MPILQDTFLGCSVINFNCSIGWGSEASSLNAQICEDPSHGDSFTSPAAGSVQVFSFNGYQFRGIIQSWRHSKSSSGFVYNVTMVDPRAILENVTLILTNYLGSVSVVSNLVNIYKYYNDNSGFGSSLLNENGTPASKIKSAALSIINSGPSVWGGYIRLGPNDFKIDLNELPSLPADFRIPGDTISLMDYISECCAAAACDYFFSLDIGNIIKLRTISRTNQPTFGLLSSYINSQSHIISSETGFEFRNEVTSKFLLGSPKQDMYFQSYSDEGTSTDYTDDTIWPYWSVIQPGYPGMGNIVVGQEINDQHYFEQDARFLNLNFPGVVVDTYLMCVGELRAALESQASWEFYLWTRDQEATGLHPTTIWYQNRATKLKLIGNVNADYAQMLGTITPVINHQGNLRSDQINESSLSLGNDHEEEIKRLYEFVRRYATEYYGKQFMVRIPDIQARYDSSTQKTYYNYEPVSYGFLDEATWPSAISSNYLPPDINQLLNENGQIQAYCRFDNAQFLDFTAVSPADIIFNTAGTSAFVKCTVEPGIFFLDRTRLTSPRAIINLSGAVKQKTGDRTIFGGEWKQLLLDKQAGGTISAQDVSDIATQFGTDHFMVGFHGMAVMPNMVAIPLMSNIDRYGPWGFAGVNGKTDFEIDNDLNPWSAGGFTAMNNIAMAKVNQAYSNMLESEFGSFEVPGVPTFDLGSELVLGGPYITDIQCSVGGDGVTTRYLLSTWSPRFGAASKLQEERLRRLNRNIQQQKAWNRTIVRKFEQAKPPKDKNGYPIIPPTQRKVTNSSHAMIAAENVKRIGGNGHISSVCVQPTYLTTAQMESSAYPYKAAVSLDALFRPFSTNTSLPPNNGSASDFPLAHYNSVAVGADSPNAYHLNPYKTGFDFGVVTRDSTYPSNLEMQAGGPSVSNDYRGVALRAPLVMTGWGYDTEDNPVPNLNDPAWNPTVYAASGYSETSFHPDYLTRPNIWPVGPLDCRWDVERQVWVAGGGGGTKVVKLVLPTSGSFPSDYNSVYRAELIDVDFSTGASQVTLSATGKYIEVGNINPNIALNGTYYFAQKIKNRYYINNQLEFK